MIIYSYIGFTASEYMYIVYLSILEDTNIAARVTVKMSILIWILSYS